MDTYNCCSPAWLTMPNTEARIIIIIIIHIPTKEKESGKVGYKTGMH
jgi:hypothetical protein